MAEFIAKNYLDYAGLSKYDSLIKTFITNADSILNDKTIQSVALKDSVLYFFRGVDTPPTNEDGSINTALACANVPLSGQDVADLQTLVGSAELTTDAKTITEAINEIVADMAALAKVATTGAAADLSVAEFTYGATTDGEGNTTGGTAIKWNDAQTAIETLATKAYDADAAIDAVEAKIAEISGEGETGILSQAKDYTDERIGDLGNKNIGNATTTSTQTVSEIIDILTGAINETGAQSKVAVEKLETPTEGYAASYKISQGAGASIAEVGVIDIPKDFLVKSAEIKVAGSTSTPGEEGAEPTVTPDPSGLPDGTTYIDFVINTKDGKGEESHIYLNVETLVKDFTVAADAEQVQLAVSDTRELSATLVAGAVKTENIADGAITTDKLPDGVITADKLDQAVQDSIGTGTDNKIQEAIEALDATVSTATEADPNPIVKVNITQTDGVITAVEAAIAENTFDAYGSAQAAYDAINAIPLTGSDSIASLFETQAQPEVPAE